MRTFNFTAEEIELLKQAMDKAHDLAILGGNNEKAKEFRRLYDIFVITEN